MTSVLWERTSHSRTVFSELAEARVRPPRPTMWRAAPKRSSLEALQDRGRSAMLSAVPSKSERRTARELVARYHETQLATVLEHVADATDAHRNGTLDVHDVHDVDEVIHHYERAAQELWKFCWSGGVRAHIEIVARIIEEPVGDDDAVDWWQRGAPPERGDRRVR
jgi:hypothetical protein